MIQTLHGNDERSQGDDGRLSWATDLTPPASYCQAAGAIFEVTIFFFESYYILKSYVH